MIKKIIEQKNKLKKIEKEYNSTLEKEKELKRKLSYFSILFALISCILVLVFEYEIIREDLNILVESFSIFMLSIVIFIQGLSSFIGEKIKLGSRTRHGVFLFFKILPPFHKIVIKKNKMLEDYERIANKIAPIEDYVEDYFKELIDIKESGEIENIDPKIVQEIIEAKRNHNINNETDIIHNLINPKENSIEINS